MLEELQRRDYSQSTAKNLPSRRQRFRQALSAVTGYARPGTHPAVSTAFVSQEVVSIHDTATYRRAAFLFLQDSAPELPRRIYSFPQVPQTTTDHTQSGRSRSID